MRNLSGFLTAPLSIAAIVLLAGCSGGGIAGQYVTPPSDTTSAQSLEALVPDAGAASRELAVADDEDGAGNIVYLLNGSYKVTATITNGLHFPVGDFIDNKANLYVANATGPNVTEYAPGGSSPSFTYSAGLADPNAVTTDTSANVYAADFGGGRASVVVEYPQGSNTPLNTCSTGLANDGVAVDARGAVFVAGYNPSSGKTNIIEYVHGLKGCSAKTLGVALNYAGALQVDSAKDLIVCDLNGNAVDIVAPPYNSVTSSISVPSLPYSVALNLRNTLVFISLPNLHEVQIDDFPSGKAVKTLGASYGFVYPAVATYPFER